MPAFSSKSPSRPPSKPPFTPTYGDPTDLSRNRRFEVAWYSQSFLDELILIYPTYAIMMLGVGLGPLQLSLLFVVWAGASLVFEVPSGVLADRVNRRNLLVAASLVKVAAFALWLVWPTFAGFALGFVVWSFASALKSGTAQAFLHDTLAAGRQADSFERVFGAERAASGAGVAVALFTGGAIAENGYLWPLALSIGMPAINAMLIAFTLVEPPRPHAAAEANSPAPSNAAAAPPHEHNLPSPGFLATLALGFQAMRSSRILTTVAMMIAVLASAPMVLEEFVGPLLEADGNFSLTQIGVWYGIVWAARTVGLTLAHRLRLTGLTRIAAGFVGINVLLGVSQLFHGWLLAAGFALYFLVSAMAEVILQGQLQRNIQTRARATVTSLAEAASEAWGLILYLLIGVAAQSANWQITFLGVACVTGAAAAAFRVLATSGRPAQLSSPASTPAGSVANSDTRNHDVTGSD